MVTACFSPKASTTNWPPLKPLNLCRSCRCSGVNGGKPAFVRCASSDAEHAGNDNNAVDAANSQWRLRSRADPPNISTPR
jgi:hypothetical protein